MEEADYSAVSKADQFLWIVQTVILADVENQASYDPRGKSPEKYSYSSVVSAMSEAVRAAKLIPSNMDATEAASEFTSFSIVGMRERRKPPRWYRE